MNPNCEKIAETSCFASVLDLPVQPDVAVFMVNPRLSLQILPQFVQSGIKKVRFQPETFDEAVLAYVQEQGLDYEIEKCLLVASPEHLVEFVAKK